MNAFQGYQLIRFSTTLLIGIVLAKVFGLATADIALYEVVLFLGNFISFFWVAAVQKGLLSLFPTYSTSIQGKVIVHFFLLLLGFTVVSVLFLFFGQSFLLKNLTQYSSIAFLHLLCWYVLFNAPAYLIEIIYIVKKQDKWLLIYGVLIHLLQLMAVTFPIYTGSGVGGIFQFLVLWSIIKFCWLLWLVWQYGQFELETALFQKIGIFIFPLCLHALLGGGMEYIDGFLVTKFFDDQQQFAIFRYGAKELPFVNLMIAALAATMIPLAVENETQALVRLKQRIRQLSMWLYPLSIVLMLSSAFLFPLVYNQDFAPSARIFNIYLLIISSRILLPQVFLYSRQHTAILVYSAIIELVVNMGLSIHLLPYFGLEGIAFATVIAYMVNKIVLMGYIRRRLGIAVKDYLDLKVYLVFNGILFGTFLFLM